VGLSRRAQSATFNTTGVSVLREVPQALGCITGTSYFFFLFFFCAAGTGYSRVIRWYLSQGGIPIFKDVRDCTGTF